MKRIKPSRDNERPSHDQISQLAYQLYERRGCRPGHELEDWLHAEETLLLETRRERAGEWQTGAAA